LVRDTDANDALLGTEVGLRPGSGGVYVATISTPQGPQTPVAIAIMAAEHGNVTVAATVLAPGEDLQGKAAVYQRADDVINSVQWGTR
jgi:hypothetical protein